MKKIKNMEPDAKISWGEKIGYALGGQGANLYLMMISSFLLVYYTNVVGIDAGLVATLMGVSKLLDGVSDIIAGRILDHTKTKYGKFRPWLLRMMIPTATCMILMFNVPAGVSIIGKAVYVFVTYNLANTICLTMMYVSNSSLSGAMTMNQADRGLNGGLYMLLGIAGGIVLNSTVLQISSAVSGGDSYSSKGWSVMIIIYTVVFIILTILQFASTNERVTLANWNGIDVGTEETGKSDDGIGIIEALKILIHDKYWVIFIVDMICVVFIQTSLNMNSIYYAQYVLGDVLLYTPLSNCLSICALLGAVISLPLLTKVKKRNLCLSGAVFLLIGAVIPVLGNDMIILYIASALRGLGTGISAGVLPGMLQDSITYAQWQSGKDVLGMGNAAYSFTNKIGASLGTIILGWMLSVGKFDGTLAVQPESAVSVIKVLYIWIPFAMSILCAICMSLYDLDGKYGQIAEELKSRRNN